MMTSFSICLQEMVLLGVALGAILLLIIVICLYFRLRSEYAAVSKDKISGFSLSALLARYSLRLSLMLLYFDFSDISLI